jgi:hypothetical protein
MIDPFGGGMSRRQQFCRRHDRREAATSRSTSGRSAAVVCTVEFATMLLEMSDQAAAFREAATSITTV